MRWLVNYIRSCFCRHSWELLFDTHVESDMGDCYDCKVYRCRRCGYSKKYKSN